MNALAERTWMDQYGDLYTSVELSWYCNKNFFTDEDISLHVDRLADELRPKGFIPTWEDIIMEYTDKTASVTSELVDLLIENDEDVRKEWSILDSQEARDNFWCEMESSIYDEMSYSQHTDHTNLLILSYALRGKCVRITPNDAFEHFGDLSIPSHLEIRLGDAQNSLFPQFTEKQNSKILEGLDADENIDLRGVVVRRYDNNLRIGGDVKWGA